MIDTKFKASHQIIEQRAWQADEFIGKELDKMRDEADILRTKLGDLQVIFANKDKPMDSVYKIKTRRRLYVLIRALFMHLRTASYL